MNSNAHTGTPIQRHIRMKSKMEHVPIGMHYFNSHVQWSMESIQYSSENYVYKYRKSM